MDDNNNNYYEHKNGQQYHEFINFAIQGMNENAQFAIAIAVGSFWNSCNLCYVRYS